MTPPTPPPSQPSQPSSSSSPSSARRPAFQPPPPPGDRAAGRDAAPGPTLAELAPEATLRRLELAVTRRLEGLLNGQHLGLLPGPGTELAEARLYQPGEDDVRHMDWAVTARTTTPHVRDLIADHELEAWALVDLTPSMAFGTTTLTKHHLAVAALAAIGYLTVRLGDRVGAYLHQPAGLRRHPARAGKPALHTLLQAVLSTDPAAGAADHNRNNRGSAGGSGGTGGGTRETLDLAAAITALDRGQKRRGLRVIISDLLPAPGTPPAGPYPWERPLRRMAARHQVLTIEIIDPRELDLPDIGALQLTDPETGRGREVVLTQRLRRDYADAAAAQRRATRDALRRAGAHHLVLRTDRDWIADVARFALRQRRAAGRPLTPAAGTTAPDRTATDRTAADRTAGTAIGRAAGTAAGTATSPGTSTAPGARP
ncbi:DUF58 domain-containing protein [Actinomadura parmotrematis]|uniref:DUF58 domain-containing protein n=1 Tax=Actinomadura parmotrematis TaxID=2864039 RepID=A0ABS7G4T0_9ACTN|nr:DUF58 domain-containing protein [Actinomadura parmotrematis]MBW8487712.1 DUF58 domain-containing protein [Actinomadura parmotrematis]